MKKWVKILIYGIGTLVLLLLLLAGGAYYYYYGSYASNDTKYPHNVGYLDPSNPDFSTDFQRCNPDKKPMGYYHSASQKAFKKSKRAFESRIRSTYENHDFSNSGIFNIRFLIDCNGNTGDYEINTLNNDYQKTSFDPKLVNQFRNILLDKNNWQGVAEEDLYMYLIITLKDGEILEILP